MDEDRRSTQRSSLFDTGDPQQFMNEVLLGVFLPGVLVFVGLWAIVRLYLDDVFLSLGFGRMTPDPLPFIALESGYGRFIVLIVFTALAVIAYIGLYLRVLREPLKKRGIV